jgi:hypothetical protein
MIGKEITEMFRDGRFRLSATMVLVSAGSPRSHRDESITPIRGRSTKPPRRPSAQFQFEYEPLASVMSRTLLATSLLAALAVVLGAYGLHRLKDYPIAN